MRMEMLLGIGMLVVIGACAVDDEPADEPLSETTQAAKPPPPPPPPRRCEVDAQGRETGRCVIDDGTMCALGYRGVEGCVVGRQGTVTSGSCFDFDQNACTATGWIF